MLFFALVCLIGGLIFTISPETGWEISEGWKFRDAEPSDNALVWCRICGIAMLVTSVVLFVKFFSGGA